MAKIESSQLEIERAGDGVWTIQPRTGRNWTTPVSVESIQTDYGSNTLALDYSGKTGASQRFQFTASIWNARGLSDMDGLLQAMFDEVRVDKRFKTAWPQPLGPASATAARTSANAAAGAGSVRMRAGDAVKVGRLVQFEANGKLHRVVSAPTGRQTAVWTMGVFPALTKAVASGSALVTAPVGWVRFTGQPLLTTTGSIVLEATVTMREAP